jgi:DNA repair protein SbcC/Rad50
VRPIRLQLKGFTAFRDEQAIDFEGLDLFGIVGPTGSGKSSLLDAITYALFGEVDRVGRGVSQLVSQGQPRMAVTFEFEAGGERYRVTRSTTSKAAGSKVLLQSRQNGEWRGAGEGADRVRDVNARLRTAIGLDYDAFTRSVLLPQGRFAEFLVGEAKDRREILTELLGLELFKRLARRAGEVRAEAAASAHAKAELVSREYAGVTAESLAAARRDARTAAARDDAVASAAKRVAALRDRAARSEAEVRELRACASDALAVAEATSSIASALEQLDRDIADAAEALRVTVEGADALAKDAADAADARAVAEGEWGTARDLAAMRARAEDLARRRGDVARLRQALDEASAFRDRIEAAVGVAESALAAAEDASKRARSRLRSARRSLDRAQHANLVAAVQAGVAVGDPCPVCGSIVDDVPSPPRGSTDVDAAGAAVEAAELELAEAEDAFRRSQRERDAAHGRRGEAAREIDRLERDLDRRARETRELEVALERVVGEDADPLATLDDRLDRLEHLGDVERTAGEAAAAAERLRAQADAALVALRARVGERRETLRAQPGLAVLERARALTDGAVAGRGVPADEDLPEEAAPLAATAARAAAAVREAASALEAAAIERGEASAALLSEALSALEGLVDADASTLDELAEAIGRAAREATAASATAAEKAERLRERLQAARALGREAAELQARAEVFSTLARELRADNVIEFLQLEALELLASGGSERLSTLSDGRYRLAFQGDEFFVVDTWNGEERRSARTLSGGETFLASLALALALAEQVQSLAVTERARLESLFLDEGFGTLDPETLEIVVAAIEQLGGGERVVGVITHVQELAIRLPARIEVEKSPRGSTLRVVS